MVEEILVESIGKYIDYIFELGKKNGEYDRVAYAFRGQKSEKYKLTSSLQRNYGNNSDFAEKRLLENFKKYGASLNSKIDNSVWRNMIIAQHHGTPTRLLDFSFSPLVALHFALIDNEKNENAVVWAINIEIMHRQLIPEKYRNVLEKHEAYSFTVEMLEELDVSVQDYNNDMNSSILFLEPPSIDARIVSQWSNFAIMPNQLDPLDDFLENSEYEKIAYKFIIPYEKVAAFRKQLDTLNINEKVLFPDLDGLSTYLKRRYEGA